MNAGWVVAGFLVVLALGVGAYLSLNGQIQSGFQGMQLQLATKAETNTTAALVTQINSVNYSVNELQNESALTQSIASLSESTIELFGTDSQGRPVPLGAGFIIRNDGYLITAVHMVDLPTSYFTHLNLTGFKRDGTRFSFEDYRLKIGTDVIILKATVNMPAVTLSESYSIPKGMRIAFIGYPLGVTQTPNGLFEQVANVGTIAHNNSNFWNTPLSPTFAIEDAAVTFGNSGGPVINPTTDKVIGMIDSFAGIPGLVTASYLNNSLLSQLPPQIS